MTRQVVPLPAARLLTRAQAASYCGLSTIVFQRECDVCPIRFGANTVQRYDRRDLDHWIDRLKGEPDAPSFDQWLDALDTRVPPDRPMREREPH
ncbi:hypothetical protein [Methylobacterium sp. WL6]|uniref:hypothetical protein n=1 Tax=Methylobacterium sp. WL6 TaxID=2603901 RepID=UPI0011C90D23|nr:hypothetical protein [Methylobacterium sp. WL6]TXN73444.1 hypothetical protein FV230_01355 [Methylobacterium sp. WL6]